MCTIAKFKKIKVLYFISMLNLLHCKAEFIRYVERLYGFVSVKNCIFNNSRLTCRYLVMKRSMQQTRTNFWKLVGYKMQQQQQYLINNHVKHNWRDQKNKQKLMMRNKSSM